MPQFAANTSILFTEVDFLQRFDAARKAGFRGVEFHFPYAWQHEDLERAARDAGVEVVLFNMPARRLEPRRARHRVPSRPRARVPRRRRRRRSSTRASSAVPRLNCLAGIAPADADPDQVLTTFVENLRYAADSCGRGGASRW